MKSVFRKRLALAWLLTALLGLVLPTRGADFSLPKGVTQSVGDDLFTNKFIRHIEIKIPPEGLAILRKYRYQRSSTTERESVPATVVEGDKVYTNVAVHLKGALGSFRPIDSGKPAFTLNFDKNVEGQRFHGLEKISLNNSVQDPTFINEKLCREIFLAAGVPVPRCDYATVELNGNDLGLYVLAEGWNKQFLRRFYRNVKGNFYDSGLSVDINGQMRAASGEEIEDRSDLKALADAAAETNHTKRIERLRQTLDLDRFLTFIALDVMMWNWDGYAINRNNFRVFHDRDAGRVVFFPHGLDQMFARPEGPLVTGVKGIVSRAVLRTSEGRRLYLERAAELRTNLFHVEAITNRVTALAARLRSSAAEGAFLGGMRYDGAVRTLKNRIIQRGESIDEQLAGVRKLLKLKKGASVALTGWESRTESGEAALKKIPGEPESLEIKLVNGTGYGLWSATVWLEEGRYAVEGRIKTKGVAAEQAEEREGAGLRVVSRRKTTDGTSWDWFPFRESRNRDTRGELPPKENHRRLLGNNEWTEVRYEFDLRQPIADLEILCELRADKGEAWFDVSSLKLTRVGSATSY